MVFKGLLLHAQNYLQCTDGTLKRNVLRHAQLCQHIQRLTNVRTHKHKNQGDALAVSQSSDPLFLLQQSLTPSHIHTNTNYNGHPCLIDIPVEISQQLIRKHTRQVNDTTLPRPHPLGCCVPSAVMKLAESGLFMCILNFLFLHSAVCFPLYMHARRRDVPAATFNIAEIMQFRARLLVVRVCLYEWTGNTTICFIINLAKLRPVSVHFLLR